MGEWRDLADLFGNMIAKYIEDIDLDSLPDPDAYFLLNDMMLRTKDLLTLTS